MFYKNNGVQVKCSLAALQTKLKYNEKVHILPTPNNKLVQLTGFIRSFLVPLRALPYSQQLSFPSVRWSCVQGQHPLATMGDVKMEDVLPPYIEGNVVFRAIRDTWTSFSERREALGLSNPGTVENIAREVQKDVFLTNHMFTGLRADWTRPLSVSPLFQYTHSFAMGSPGLPPYGFSTIFGTPTVYYLTLVDCILWLMLYTGLYASQPRQRWPIISSRELSMD